ncbi:phage shock protein PspA [Teredinibacter turnerae]|uniref:Phage shock protein A n=1 Tax=Teredinibacter turnerae (strain ATCC 39867 / T7901) TaxID=377629 RepID=C5BML8_TERTT|nr:phage shock protein PspA [Teredinibacter turnerae]ACR12605.1 phage shock protein A [Teredinibacter turnerae T7901]
MGIFSRFSDIINSNINALLDKAEDPEKMVRLIIQEMEETLVEVRTVSAKAIADKKELLRRKQWLMDQSETWEEKAELAIQKGREDLAKGALAEKLRFINDASQVDTELEIIEENLLSLENEITQLQNKIAEAKARQKSLVSRRQTADSKLKVRMVIRGGSVDEKLSKLEGYERKLDELEGKVESYDLGKKSLAEEIEQLAKDEEIEAQLAALREKVKTKTENN